MFYDWGIYQIITRPAPRFGGAILMIIYPRMRFAFPGLQALTPIRGWCLKFTSSPTEMWVWACCPGMRFAFPGLQALTPIRGGILITVSSSLDEWCLIIELSPPDGGVGL